MAVALGLALVVIGCAGPEGFWRDQYVFVGDEGTVVPLGVLRWSDGRAEVKGWLGQGERWQTSMHHRFAILGRDAPSVERALAALSTSTGAPARVTLDAAAGDAGPVRVRIRTATRDVVLSAGELHALGESTDPEGTSTYRAGRGRLRSGQTQESGWLVVESTPAERPKRSFVDYGDYALVLAASRERGVLVVERSLDVPGFDRAFVGDASATAGSGASAGSGAGSARQTAGVTAEVGAERLRVRLPGLGVETSLSIADRGTSRGVDPKGRAVRYETLLLRGDYSGVAFLIHRESGGAT